LATSRGVLRNQKSWPEVPLAKLQWSHLAQSLAELALANDIPVRQPHQAQ